MPVQPGTHRAISRRPEADVDESESRSILNAVTGPVARVMFALPFFVFGINHFAMPGQLAGTVPEFLPGSVVWVYMTGIVHLATSIAIMANRLVRAAGILLAAMLLTFVATVHLPALLGGEGTGAAMTNMLKDTALAGGALLAAHFAQHRDQDDGETT
ncbi:MAG: DoxX family membrane protein [Bradymonadaceae bacterium]